MAGVYMLSHPYEPNTYKLGCSQNIAQRMKSGDFNRMFLPGNMPKLIGWISVDGYETANEVRFLEQSIFHQLSAKRICSDRELFKDVTFDEIANCISNLQLTPKKHLDAPIDNGIRPKKKINFTNISVKDFQVPILVNMKTYFNEHQRGKLILPCGYGKMYLALFLIRDKFNTAIVACPNLILCQQFTDIARQICGEHKVGSQETTKWIIITTYHSIEKYKGYNPDLFIVDEAHHTCVTSKTSEEESLFRSLLTFPANKYLFMTATEKVLDQNVKDEEDNNNEEYNDDSNKENIQEIEEDKEIWYSMDNKEFYGDEIYRKNFSDAIDEGIISDYRLAVVNSGDPIQVITTARKTLGIKWLLTYHNSCESAYLFSQNLNSNGIPAFYIDGNVSMERRTHILLSFENTPYSVLCSVNVLAEGVSLPFVDSTYFVDPRGSEIDVIQRIGRCLRLHKDKSLATILLPENILEYAALLRSLVIYDPKARNSIRRKVIGLKFSQDNLSDTNKFANIKFNLDICIMGRWEAQWISNWRLCMEFEQKSKELIKERIKYEGVNIGVWISNQKSAIQGKGNGRAMNDDHLKQLLELTTMRKWYETKDNKRQKVKISWEDKLSLCVEYEKLKGLIRSDISYKEVNIYSWLQTQKQAMQDKDNIKMDDDRRNKLFVLITIQKWYQNLKYDNDWMIKYQLCVDYEEPNGLIKWDTVHNDINIGYWITTQKNAIQGKGHAKMNDTRWNKLFELTTIQKWHQNLEQDNNWMSKYHLCIEYEKSHDKIQEKTTYKDTNIGSWIRAHKKAVGGKGGSKMNETRLAQLLNSRSFYEWYIKNQDKCLPEFQGFHLQNYQQSTVSCSSILDAPSSIRLNVISSNNTNSN